MGSTLPDSGSIYSELITAEVRRRRDWKARDLKAKGLFSASQHLGGKGGPNLLGRMNSGACEEIQDSNAISLKGGNVGGAGENRTHGYKMHQAIDTMMLVGNAAVEL
jgi:hypothetical protein